MKLMEHNIKKIKTEILTLGRGIALISALFLVISAFMTWGYTDYASVTGGLGDGMITRIIGVAAFVFLFIKRINIWASLVLGLISLGISINDYISLTAVLKTLSGNVGSGMYVTILSSVGLVLGTVIEMIYEKKNKLKLFYIDEQ